MRVYVYPADLTGCGYYRLIWPAEELRRQGWDVEIKLPDKRNLTAVVDQRRRQVVDVMPPADADVMVFQRVTNLYMAQCIPILVARGVAVVVDQDDDLSRVHRDNPAWLAMHPERQRRGQSDHSWLSAEAACDAATLVTVSAPALMRRYATRRPGLVVRNAVPDRYLEVEHRDSELVGWPAALHSHGNDAARLGDSIQRLQRDGVEFATIGDPRGMQTALRLPRPPRFFGPVPLDEWPGTLAQIGIGVAPLDHDTTFNHSKSWLKPLELAACGVPVVMSPGREYREIHRRGVGLLADGPSAFYRQLTRLVRDPGLRAELSARGREAARTQVLSARAAEWGEAWQLAHDLRREQGPATWSTEADVNSMVTQPFAALSEPGGTAG